MTDYPYKAKIEEAVLAYPDRFSVPDGGAREYLLQNRCRADFCFTMKPQGRLFIEDDDGMRGLQNLIKFWIWCEANPSETPIHVVHILETSRPAAIQSIQFLGDKMQQQIPGFAYHVITLPDWQGPDEDWLPEIRNVLAGIAQKGV